mmetsp:Transcript_58965/g.173075  ORF Transcript_58965/g.173075 Transcript_58965/m.173075 type:complete len:119 (-) Transcript_58965:762-1118(-)
MTITCVRRCCSSGRGWCSVMRTGILVLASRTSLTSSRLEAASSPLVGSSKTRICGLRASSMATATRRVCPGERSPIRWFSPWPMMGSCPGVVRTRPPRAKAMASATVSSGRSVSCWGT